MPRLSLIYAIFLAIMVREENAVASIVPALFSSQFAVRWSTTRISEARDARFPAKSLTDDANLEPPPHLCRRRRLPGQRRNLPGRRPPRPARQRGRGPIHPGAA